MPKTPSPRGEKVAPKGRIRGTAQPSSLIPLPLAYLPEGRRGFGARVPFHRR